MTTVTIYYAYDGTEFDSAAKCKDYERHASFLMHEFNRRVLLLDIMKRPIICPTSIRIEDIMAWFHQAYGICSYVSINAELSNDLITLIDHNLGLIFPPNKIGLYKYDYDNDEWVSAD